MELIALLLLGKQLHWNIVGHGLRELHLQLDEFVDSWRDPSFAESGSLQPKSLLGDALAQQLHDEPKLSLSQEGLDRPDDPELAADLYPRCARSVSAGDPVAARILTRRSAAVTAMPPTTAAAAPPRLDRLAAATTLAEASSPSAAVSATRRVRASRGPASMTAPGGKR